MQENGRKLCSLIDVQEDVVPAWEIYPSLAFGEIVSERGTVLWKLSLTVRILNQAVASNVRYAGKAPSTVPVTQ